MYKRNMDDEITYSFKIKIIFCNNFRCLRIKFYLKICID